MALKSFGRGPEMPGATTPSPSAPSGGSTAGGLTAFIDQGSEFEGKLSFRDTVRIDGRFRGEISSENTLIVGESGEIEATIRSNTIAVSGSVVGDIHAGRKVVLHKTARVEGNIEAASLAIEDGAVLNGNVKMVTDARKDSGPLKSIPGGGGQKSGEGSTPKS
jgi:cytoskeletal protein CcmA (bactofilin family)